MQYHRTILATLFALGMGLSLAYAEDQGMSTEAVWLPSLQAETPEAGFDLAIKLSRRTVKTIQPDVDVLKKLRPVYSHDPDSLIGASNVVANYFSTIAEANNYWRD